jgi:hypothetical protein
LGHTLVLATFSLQFSGKRRKANSRIALECLSKPAVFAAYQQTLAAKLVKISARGIDGRWNNKRDAIHSSASLAYGTSRNAPVKP